MLDTTENSAPHRSIPDLLDRQLSTKTREPQRPRQPADPVPIQLFPACGRTKHNLTHIIHHWARATDEASRPEFFTAQVGLAPALGEEGNDPSPGRSLLTVAATKSLHKLFGQQQHLLSNNPSPTNPPQHYSSSHNIFHSRLLLPFNDPPPPQQEVSSSSLPMTSPSSPPQHNSPSRASSTRAIHLHAHTSSTPPAQFTFTRIFHSRLLLPFNALRELPNIVTYFKQKDHQNGQDAANRLIKNYYSASNFSNDWLGWLLLAILAAVIYFVANWRYAVESAKMEAEEEEEKAM